MAYNDDVGVPHSGSTLSVLLNIPFNDNGSSSCISLVLVLSHERVEIDKLGPRVLNRMSLISTVPVDPGAPT